MGREGSANRFVEDKQLGPNFMKNKIALNQEYK